MTRTFTSSTYALGAFLVAVFAGALGYFCLHEVGVVGQRPLTLSKFPLFVLPPLALLSLGCQRP